MKVDWTKHNAIAERFKARMETVVRKFDPSAEFEMIDDARVEGMIERADGNKLGVSFAIWDSGDADDGVYGVHGNFVFDLVEWGGRIVGHIIPDNYSDRVWVDYDDLDEWETRMSGIENSVDAIHEAIENWKGEAQDGQDE